MIAYLGLLLRYVLLLLLCAFAASFVLSNDQVVTVGMFPLPYEISAPLYALMALLLIGGLVSGLIIASLYHSAKLIRLRRDVRSKSEQLNALQQEAQAKDLERRARETFHSEGGLLHLPGDPAY